MKPYQSALAVFLGTATAALPSAAQYVSPPPILASQACVGCFAYLEFAPQLEPESHAMRGEATETSASLPAANEPSGLSGEQTAGLLVSSKK